MEPAVFPLVIQAGGGSARDSLSVLDQLLAGAGDEGVTYRNAVELLGVTDAALLDEMVDALAAGDGSSVFGVVDKVVEAGHDPRRFAADLLQRMRDLVILSAVPDAATKGLIDAPDDQLALMVIQAEKLGTATVSRFAEVLHTGLVEMRGTTSPRLVLELMCARMLLPAASLADSALLQRLERMERRMSIAGEDPGPGTGQQGRAELPAPAATHLPAPVTTRSASTAPARPDVAARVSEALRSTAHGDPVPDVAPREAPAEPASRFRRPSQGLQPAATTRQDGRTDPTSGRAASGPDLGLPAPPRLSTTRPAAQAPDRAGSQPGPSGTLKVGRPAAVPSGRRGCVPPGMARSQQARARNHPAAATPGRPPRPTLGRPLPARSNHRPALREAKAWARWMSRTSGGCGTRCWPRCSGIDARRRSCSRRPPSRR